MQTRFTHRLLAGAGIVACAATLLVARPASAQTEAITDFDSTNAYQLAGFSVGYTFSLSTTISVTDLAYFDFLANGLTESHVVGVYDSTGTQLFTSFIGAGITSPAGATFDVAGENGVFRYSSLITPQVLAAGTYTIAAYTGDVTGTTADPFFFSATSITTSTPVGYGAGVATFTPGGLSTTAPVGGATGVSYFGPSFRYNVGGVAGPEPGTFVLLGTGLLSMGGVTLRRRSKKAAK